MMAIMFINTTILTQCEWDFLRFVNASKIYIKQINNMLCRAYKLALGLPRSSANCVCWKFSGQNLFETRMSRLQTLLIGHGSPTALFPNRT